MDAFASAMTSFEFLPNTPCLMNAGRPARVQLAASFLCCRWRTTWNPFSDLRKPDCKAAAQLSFSRIRPEGDSILPAYGISGGPRTFIELFDSATYVIDRNRVRPGANMGVLNVDHPDIETLSDGSPSLKNYNLSVAVNDQFLVSGRGQDYPGAFPDPGRGG
ncbi:MAG: hypothetical protein R2860_10910 [Desulfobacterales bacterium]